MLFAAIAIDLERVVGVALTEGSESFQKHRKVLLRLQATERHDRLSPFALNGERQVGLHRIEDDRLLDLPREIRRCLVSLTNEGSGCSVQELPYTVCQKPAPHAGGIVTLRNDYAVSKAKACK